MQGIKRNPNRSEIRAAIERAFADLPLPKEEEIVVGDDPDSIQITDDFGGCRWREITLDKLLYHREAFCFMTDTGIQYYLPAYLVASLDYYEQSDLIPDHVIYNLSPHEYRDEESGAYQRLICGFTAQQIDVICQTLEWLQREHGDDYPDREPERTISAIRRLCG